MFYAPIIANICFGYQVEGDTCTAYIKNRLPLLLIYNKYNILIINKHKDK